MSMRYFSRLQEVLPGRAFFTTLDGFIGLCPAAARSGDCVCVILGSTAPLLLRPSSGGQYKLVGECYIHGLMQGQGLLGPIPSSWERKTYIVDGVNIHMMVHGGKRYCDGNPRKRLFENCETGVRTFFDLRLTSEALVARGVDIMDFILV
jgi:hypothetical protein